MTRFISFILLSYYLLSCIAGGAKAVDDDDDDDDDFAIAGYLPDYRLRAYLDQHFTAKNAAKTQREANQQPQQSPHVATDLILFSLQPHARGFLGCCLEPDHYELVEEFVNSTIRVPFSTSPSTRVWVTVGGGGRRAAFPEICANGMLRQRLIGSITNLSSKYSFIGGIDLDFFQPRTMQERDNYLLFLSEAIPQWHQEGLKVSITLHPNQGRMVPRSIYQQLDRIHFMTYDMVGGYSDGDYRNFHAYISKVRQALQELFQHGIGLENTPEKVLLGIPAYARHLGEPSQVKTYGEIYDEIRSQDANADIGVHAWEGYEWDSPSRIRDKINLARKMKLGGIFFWELGQDKITTDNPSGTLLEAAAAAASAGSPSPMGEL
eukprot:jgi/Psemu1/11270/gm1.11270_g